MKDAYSFERDSGRHGGQLSSFTSAPMTASWTAPASTLVSRRPGDGRDDGRGSARNEYMGPMLRRRGRGRARRGTSPPTSRSTLSTPGVEKRGEDYVKDGEPLQRSSPRSRSATSSSSAPGTPSRLGRPTWMRPGRRFRTVWMASYGFGPARIAAAAVEQFADEQGISWPRALAPFDCAPGGPRQARDARARRLLMRLYSDAPQRWGGGALRRPPARPRREVRRRRAARLPAPFDGRAALVGRPAGSRSRCVAGAPMRAGLPLGGDPPSLLGALDALWRSLP